MDHPGCHVRAGRNVHVRWDGSKRAKPNPPSKDANISSKKFTGETWMAVWNDHGADELMGLCRHDVAPRNSTLPKLLAAGRLVIK